MLAVHLARAGIAVSLIERSERPARGVAYSTNADVHLLNVRAGSMSAWPDRPADFAEWLAREGLGGAADFARRRDFGRYLGEQLGEAGELVTLVDGEATAIVDGHVVLSDRRTITADAIVLATGNLPPHTPRIIAEAGLNDGRYAEDPWTPEALQGLEDGCDVLVIGTGLTMVDVVMQLDRQGFGGRVIALSRRGLMPRAHLREPGLPPDQRTDIGAFGAGMVGAVRRLGDEIGWRNAVDGLRGVTQSLWREANDAARSRFLRHLRPYWDVHRHRIAPQIAERLAALEATGRLVVRAGRIASARPVPDGVQVHWTPRGANASEAIAVARIINCTGPQSDVERSDDPFISALVRDGAIRPDPLHIGIDIAPTCAVIGHDGQPSERLFAIGPMTKGALWEIVAVPDIRHQVAALATHLVQRLAGESRATRSV